MIKKRILSTVCAAAIGFSCMTGLSAYAQTDSESAYSSQTASIDAVKLDLPVERLSGSNRYATAAVISQKGHPNGAKNVVLANAQIYADALCVIARAEFAFNYLNDLGRGSGSYRTAVDYKCSHQVTSLSYMPDS